MLPAHARPIAPLSLTEQQIEHARMHDVLVLFSNLVQREKATAEAVVDCLYDIGSARMINQKIRYRPINRLMKQVAKMSKPAFRSFAMRWVQNQSPEIVAGLLYTQVLNQIYGPRPTQPPLTLEQQLRSAAAPISLQSASELQTTREMQRLRTQVRRLTGVAIATTTALTATLGIVSYRLDTNPMQLLLHQTASDNLR